jgi:hypothetical protein
VFNGLNALILKENNCAYYVNCFAHQLQLVSVAVAQKHQHLSTLFNFLSTTQNIVGASCKKYDKLHDNHAAKIKEALENDLSTGRGLNQETSLARPGDTRWNSYYKSLVNLIVLFESIIDVLDDVKDNVDN